MLLVLIYLITMALIYRGFFYPDETFVEANPLFVMLSTMIKILFPIFIIIILLFYIAVYLKKIKLSSALLLIISLIIVIFLVYPIAEYLYQSRYNLNPLKYHTFLQLTPPNYEDIDTSKFNIYCLGGSTTEFKDKMGRDWPSLVEKSLKEKYGLSQIRVSNFGKQWYTTQHSLINYIQNLRCYKPDLIIIMHNINDLLQNADHSRFSNGKFRADYGHFLGPEMHLIKYRSFIGFAIDIFDKLWYQEKTTVIDTNYFPGLLSFERNLHTLIDLTKSDGTKLVLMTQPNIYKISMNKDELKVLTMLNKEAIGDGKKWSFGTALNGINQYNNKIREIAEKSGLDLIDLESYIPKSLDYFYDDVHYEIKAYELIADKVSEELNKILTSE